MPKYLNVDDLAPEKKVLTLKGIDHEMHEVTVKEFIEITQTADKDGKVMKDLPVYEQVTMLIQQIVKAFPTAPIEDLESLSLPQLTAILKFTAGILEEESEAKEDVKSATSKKK